MDGKMEFNVYHFSPFFGIRLVQVPADCWNDDTELLERIFYWGQNEFQPLDDHPSVSTGDVIELNDRFYEVLDLGFKEVQKPYDMDDELEIYEDLRMDRTEPGFVW